MKCPIRSFSYKGEYGQDQYEDMDCLQEECAWWDKDNSQCGVTTLANGMWILDQLVTGIVKKMPPHIPPH